MHNHELIKRCIIGEPNAQRQLYDMYKGRLMGLCRRYARSREEAQDVLQESFIKIFLKMHQMESPDKLEGWMKKVTIHTALNYYTRNKKFEYQEVEGLQPANNDYEELLAGLSDELLLKIINELPDGCRIVFNLYVIEGYSHAEIAEMLTITESTSRSQFHHSKSLLRAKLKSVGIVRYEKYA